MGAVRYSETLPSYLRNCILVGPALMSYTCNRTARFKFPAELKSIVFPFCSFRPTPGQFIYEEMTDDRNPSHVLIYHSP
jgi:hypothetical protein